ncbi:MAG: hypothetical protein RM021_005650 [Nostoc sp. EkiNYC01]|nr:hypothetical protein [Nostoc sp. EkiNYC01]
MPSPEWVTLATLADIISLFDTHFNTARFVHFQLGIWFWQKVKG